MAFLKLTSSLCKRCFQRIPITSKSCDNASETSFLNGTSSRYIEDMYNAWLTDASSVHKSWDSYFRTSNYHPPPSPSESPGRAEVTTTTGVKSHPFEVKGRHQSKISQIYGYPEPDSACLASAYDQQLAYNIIRAYQVRGHLIAKLDPLEIAYQENSEIFREFDLLDLDLDKIYIIPSKVTYIGGNDTELPLREIIRRLEEAYCTNIGAEFMHIYNFQECDWIRQRLEPPGVVSFADDEKRLLLERLIASSEFEIFLAKKWPSEKRFGLEGCEMMIPSIKTVFDRSTELGVENFILGMPHRGRLNVLANICRKPLSKIFSQFQALKTRDQGSGDVKYHLGTYIERINRVTSKNMRISIAANPSHLETVSPIVQGRTRAEQFFRGDCGGEKTLSILLHGDAAFSGQGIVYETLNLTNLPAYTTKGTIHIIVNNQIGFTTDPRFSRSSPHCTDVARVNNAPIFHVNADSPESVIHVSKMAADFRAKFHKDVVIDLVCYRRNGHNETDDPSFTQPLMYTKIRSMPSVLDKYIEKVVTDGLVTEEQVMQAKVKFHKICEDGLADAKKQTEIIYRDWIDTPWSSFFSNLDFNKIEQTGIQERVIIHIGRMFASPPHNNIEDFIIHKGLQRILKARMELVEKRQMDWALGEAIAYGSLLKDGIHVRLSGEDVERGTFSHRHHILHHQTVDKATHCILSHLYPDQAPYSVCNSALTEYAVLCFELGYSLYNPKTLVIWEAQFGDFANTAQAAIDTVIASGEAKWIRQSGLVMYLPHGMEGQGPEHSSARLERYLQLTTGDPDIFPPESDHFGVNELRETNWIVANVTTPANLFHILRRQIAMPFRKPLVLMTGKSLLRHPEVRSTFEEIMTGTEFKCIISDEGLASKDPTSVKRLIFCSGKVYYDIKHYLKEKKLENQIAVTRIEQLAPFPFDLVKKECAKYPTAELIWCQEEHKNQGAWGWVKPRIDTSVSAQRHVNYIGRSVSASTATGSKIRYTEELNQLLQEAADINNNKSKHGSKEGEVKCS